MPQHEQEQRAAFDAWAIEKRYAYRDSSGLWFYPQWGSVAMRAGWDGGRASALEEAAQTAEAMHEEDRPGDYAYAIRSLKPEVVAELARREAERRKREAARRKRVSSQDQPKGSPQ